MDQHVTQISLCQSLEHVPAVSTRQQRDIFVQYCKSNYEETKKVKQACLSSFSHTWLSSHPLLGVPQGPQEGKAITEQIMNSCHMEVQPVNPCLGHSSCSLGEVPTSFHTFSVMFSSVSLFSFFWSALREQEVADVNQQGI